MNAKTWFKSKTLWFNVLTIAGMVVQSMGDKNFIDPQYVVIGAALINMLLRKLTNSPLGK